VALRDVWDNLSGFFDKKDDQLRDIDQERFGDMGSLSGGSYTSWGKYSNQMNSLTTMDHDLYSRNLEYEQMDGHTDIAAALDIYADEATQPDFFRRVPIWVESTNNNVASELNALLHKRLRVSSWLWELTRGVCKYGQQYQRWYVGEDGIIASEPVPAPATRKVYDQYGHALGYLVSKSGTGAVNADAFRRVIRSQSDFAGNNVRSLFSRNSEIAFYDWELSHFKLQGRDRMSDYGWAVTEPVRGSYRRLIIMEDSALVYKLTRAPSRLVFYVDTGELTGRQAMAQVNVVKDALRTKKHLSKNQPGKMELTFDPTFLDDFFLPVHSVKGRSVEIDTLQGPDYQAMMDVVYFKDQVGRGLKIPDFGRSENSGGGTGLLSQRDFRFAAMIMRIQRAVCEGFRFACHVHLIALGYDPYDFDFEIVMAVPSAILELARMEVLSAKSDIISRLGENISVRWLMVNLLGLSEDEAVMLMVQRQEELDFVAGGELDRESARERMSSLMREGADMSDAAVTERAEAHIKLKGSRGARGVTLNEFYGGSNDHSPSKILKELQTNHRDLLARLNNLSTVVESISSHHGMSSFAQSPPSHK